MIDKLSPTVYAAMSLRERNQTAAACRELRTKFLVGDKLGICGKLVADNLEEIRGTWRSAVHDPNHGKSGPRTWRTS